jgi:hypothetical protein
VGGGLANLGTTVVAGLSADYGRIIAAESEKWGKAIRDANMARRLSDPRFRGDKLCPCCPSALQRI